jgi:hypothetical protein
MSLLILLYIFTILLCVMYICHEVYQFTEIKKKKKNYNVIIIFIKIIIL